MDEESLIIAAAALPTQLLPRLLRRVFHVTPRETYARILSDGAIRSNQSGELGFSFPQSEVSYFRKRGCVCVLDLRVSPQQVDDALGKWYFLNPFPPKNRLAFLLLKDGCYGELVSRSYTQGKVDWREFSVPYVEAGFPAEIPLSFVERVLLVDIEIPPEENCDGCIARLCALLAKNAEPDDVWTCPNCGAKKPSISHFDALVRRARRDK